MRDLAWSVSTSCAVVLAGCTAFADDTRIATAPKDGGTNGDADAQADGENGEAVGGVCNLEVPPGANVAGCGGPGGGIENGAFELEPNDATAARLSANSVVCGQASASDVDRYTFELGAGQCFWISFVSGATASVRVTGAGVDETRKGAVDLALQATAAGAVTVTVSDAPHYKLALRD